jgi:transcriptional regulator with XRE-family HTH domain
MERFGEKLRALRERHGMTQQKLAAELGFTHAHLYRLETGKKKPNAELLVKLSRLFGVSVDVLVKDELNIE